jgi:hypothetical protein
MYSRGRSKKIASASATWYVVFMEEFLMPLLRWQARISIVCCKWVIGIIAGLPGSPGSPCGAVRQFVMGRLAKAI